MSLLKSLIVVAMLASPMVMNFCISYTSKKKIFRIFVSIYVAGSILLVTSSSMALAIISLFILGFGLASPYWYCISMVTEITEPRLSKSFTSTIDGAFSFGGILVSLMYGWVKDWRYVSLYLILIPGIIMWIITFLFVEDTPYSLIKSKSVAEICRSLNRIGKINKGEDNLIT